MAPFAVALATVLVASQAAFAPAVVRAVAGDPIRYAYDPNGRLTAVIDPNAGSAQYSYDAAGNTIAITRRAANVVAVLEFAPRIGAAGTSVSISGTGFSATPSQNTVKFNGTTATVTASTTTEVVATVPSNATTGTIQVTTPSGSSTSAVAFTVQAPNLPTISSVSVAIGAPGTALTVTGTNFSTTIGLNNLRVNKSFATVTAATATSLTATIPAGTGSGRVTVGTMNGQATSAADVFIPLQGFTASQVQYTGRATYGVPTTVSIPTAGKKGMLVFDGTAGDRIAVTFGSGTLNGYAYLIDPTGFVHAPNSWVPQSSASWGPKYFATGGFIDAIALPQSGTYALFFDAYTTGSLPVTVTKLPPDFAATGTIGGPATTLTTTVPGQNATLTFGGTTNQKISVRLASGTYTGAVINVSIKNPDGSYLVNPYNIDNSGSFIDRTTLPATGDYTLVFDPASAATGSMAITVYDVPADFAATGTIGGPATTLTISVPGQNATLTFAGTIGQKFSVTIGSNNFELFDVSIKNPDGSYLVNPFAVGNGGATIPTTTMAQAGNYVLLVDGRTISTGSVPVTLNDQGFGLAPIQTRVLAGPGPRVKATNSRHSAPIAKPGRDAVVPFANGDDDTWIPGPGNTHGDWRSHRPTSAAERVPRLLAEKGVTALSGLVLDLGGDPLTGVTLAIGETSARTDSKGRFLIKEAASGRQMLEIDGSTSDRRGKTYGLFEFSVDVAPGVTTVMPRVIWLPRIDTQHTVAITAPTTKEIVVTTPYVKGLELHIPKGTTITDEDGEPVTELSITPIPVDRTPFPLPDYVQVPVYFTIQPGGAYVDKKNAWLVYPNYPDFEPGSSHPFWHYDPEDKGWYVYGHGTVTDDGRQVVADKSTRLYEFTGAMFGGNGQDPAGNGPEPGSDSDDGDPVDLGTGLFVLSKTDVILPATMPLTVTRTYRQLDSKPRPFGIGANWNFGLFLSTTAPGTYQAADLNLPDGGQVHYVRTSTGTSYSDAVFETTSSPTAFYKSQITWNGVGWTLRLRDGTKYIFHNEIAPLSRIEDRFGNSITLSRDTPGSINITQATSSDGRWVKFGYDASNRVTSATDNAGRVTGYQYDAAGYLWKVTNPKSGVTTYTYDASNRMATIQDARLITFLTNEYWPDGKVKKQTQADSTTFQFAYTIDGNGKVTQTDVTDPRGYVHRVTFNAAGYPLTDTRAYGTAQAQTTTYVRQTSGQLPTSITDALGRRTDIGYNAAGSVTSVTRLAGTGHPIATSTTYEQPFELVGTVTDPLSHVTTLDYDEFGRMTSITDPRQKATAFTSNAAGQPLTITDATNKTTTLEYAFGDLAKKTDPLGKIVRRFVDGAGRVAATTDPLADVTRTDYDALNRPTKITDPLSGLSQFTYDANGNMLTLSDPRNGVTTYTYDSMDRPATRKDALLRTESYVFDANGNLTKVTDRNAIVTTYQYDPLNRRTFAGFKTQGTAPNFTYESTIDYTYDGGNRMRTAVDSGSGTITLAYDDLDRLTSEASQQGTTTSVFDDAGRRTLMTLAGQPQVTYAYDDADRLTSITQASAVVGFTYDDVGRVLTTTLPNNVVGTYTYDDASHIKTITYAINSTTIGDLVYAYDAVGRRTTVAGTLARTSLPAAVSTTTYNANNQLTKWISNSIRPTYDNNGNMLTDGTYTYVWNARNQLIQLKQGSTVVGSFAYDAAGRRVSKTVSGTTTGFAYDGGNFIQEKNGAGAPTANLVTGGADEFFGRTDSVGGRFPLIDALGSTLALTDGAGVIQTSYTYEPFGKTAVSGTASANAQRFTGREDDGPLYFYRARYYHPVFGRFISEDPSGFAGGDPNLYRYAVGSPTNLTDASGRWVDTALDIAFVISDLWTIATGSRKEAQAAWGSLGLDLISVFLPFAFGLGHVDDVVRLGDEGIRYVDDVIAAACSFSADTPVATEDGPVRIDQVEPGDEVIAYDPATGQAGRQRVTAVVSHLDDQIETLLVDEETILTTPDHLFLTTDRGWIPAVNLRVGEAIRKADGTSGVVKGLTVAERHELMWDLAVEDVHTFAVGDGGLVVHNKCGPQPKVPRVGGKAGATDIPSWVRNEGYVPYQGEKPNEAAKRILDSKYGPGNYETGPGSEYSQVKKWVSRHFDDE